MLSPRKYFSGKEAAGAFAVKVAAAGICHFVVAVRDGLAATATGGAVRSDLRFR